VVRASASPSDFPQDLPTLLLKKLLPLCGEGKLELEIFESILSKAIFESKQMAMESMAVANERAKSADLKVW
jgi:hypothetical protein